jgi:hypothetical protein
MSKLILAAILALSFSAFGADSEYSHSTKVDNSKNPITGTKKHKVTREAKQKSGDAEAEQKTTETTKTYSDGKTEKDTETHNESEPQ